MKKSIFLSFILCLCLIACIPQQVMAQKQSRMEKLLRYLNDNDADKWQKNREKLDDETKAYYAEDLSLMDVLNDLWNGQSEQAATLYFGCYEKAAQSNFPGICEGEKIPLSQIRDKADQSIINLLEASKDKIPFSRALLDSIHATEYPVDSAMLQRLQNIREVALLEGMLKTPHSHHLSDLRQGVSQRQIYCTSQRLRKRTALPTGEDGPDSCKLQSLL